MRSTAPLSDLRILVRDDEDYYRYAKVDLLDAGNGLMIYDYQSREKLSVHADGTIYKRPAGTGQHLPPSTSVPFSDIEHQVVRTVPIPVDATEQLPRYYGDPSQHVVFSSTVMASHGTFAAEVVADSGLDTALAAWQNHPDYVSAQTWRPTGTGKTVILTILNQRST